MADLRTMEPLTLVLGASPDPSRYSYLAVQRLMGKGQPVLAVGKRSGNIGVVEIKPDVPEGTQVHTVTLYLAPGNQRLWEDRLLALHPSRVIFNPGTENDAFAARLREAGIEVVEACTLVMLATSDY